MTRDEVIKLLYKGDVKLYEEVIRNTNKYVDPVDPDFNLAINWKTVEQATQTYPEYERESISIIENFLEYVPNPQIYLPHQPFIKALSASFYRGELTEKQLIPELEFHCKRIRNDDMKKYGWAANRKYDEADYHRYDTHLAAYKQKARDRLSEMIGAEPPLEYSLGAEIYMRQVFLPDDYHDDQPYTIFENRAATISSYRELLISVGPEAADESVLYGQYLCDYYSLSPYTRRKLEK